MTPASILAPGRVLGELTMESRLITTPWSRMVRGIGLGQYPIDHDPVIAGYLRATFDHLSTKVPDDAYTRFSQLLTDLLLRVTGPGSGPGQDQLRSATERILEVVRSEPNPYRRLSAGCILMDAFAKAGLPSGLLAGDRDDGSGGEADLPGEILGWVNEIHPDRIEDENQGRHGEYERLSAYTSVFLAFGQLGLQDRLVSGGRDHVREALGLLDRVPAPFFRGRGGSMLLAVTSLIGFGDRLLDDDRDHLREVLTYVGRADELGNPPVFPGAMTAAFPKVYPLLTMLNAVAVSGRHDLLAGDDDPLGTARRLMAEISPVERTHMGLYYVMALDNLGRLDRELPAVDEFVEDVVGQWRFIDPGADFFLHGISYPYIIQTAMIGGRLDLVPAQALERLADSFADLDRSDADRANRPYPLSYALNVLGEVGAADLIFTPRARYSGLSAVDWMIHELSPGAYEERGRFYLLNHALISYALRMRGADRPETALFSSFRLPAGPDGGEGGAMLAMSE